MNLLLPAFTQPLEWIPGCQHDRLHGQAKGRQLVCEAAQIWGWRSSLGLHGMDDEQLVAEEPDALTYLNAAILAPAFSLKWVEGGLMVTEVEG
ncbi:hypothetical protein EHF33_13720 [Deinococcus psychrotolerans]|uniref:Uncharacterized protein n=1 Tax=Deinococcus psychrotolerans TaxID=2489213 RepID=A0A3G8YHE3_9DEIO|nr:hypothetical protein [Deinococcus psychrotolerans]AZI44413.1 hypothetical protein EHF33_13720 [Deinococcus psychrotolerans]